MQEVPAEGLPLSVSSPEALQSPDLMSSPLQSISSTPRTMYPEAPGQLQPINVSVSTKHTRRDIAAQEQSKCSTTSYLLHFDPLKYAQYYYHCTLNTTCSLQVLLLRSSGAAPLVRSTEFPFTLLASTPWAESDPLCLLLGMLEDFLTTSAEHTVPTNTMRMSSTKSNKFL